MTDAEYVVKLHAEAHIDEMAGVSSRGQHVAKDTKNHPFAKDGFNYRTAYFMDGNGRYYRVQMSIGINGGINTIYNVGRIDKTAFPVVGELTPSGSEAKAGNAVVNSIASAEGKVKAEMADGEGIRYSERTDSEGSI